LIILAYGRLVHQSSLKNISFSEIIKSHKTNPPQYGQQSSFLYA
jgi:hypothetical protein